LLYLFFSSANGTWVNRVKVGKGKSKKLKNQDIIMVLKADRKSGTKQISFKLHTQDFEPSFPSSVDDTQSQDHKSTDDIERTPTVKRQTRHAPTESAPSSSKRRRVG
jgi:hypothetical protein